MLRAVYFLKKKARVKFLMADGIVEFATKKERGMIHLFVRVRDIVHWFGQ
jgi:hypothetical protein